MIWAGAFWFLCGAAVTALGFKARRNANEFEDRLEALESELDARGRDLH